MLEYILLAVIIILTVNVVYKVYKCYFLWCSKSPCKAVRETGRCPYDGKRACADCEYFDKNKEKTDEN